MYITYEEYKGFGYNLLSESDFNRFIMRATMIVEKHTLGRVNDSFLTQETHDLDLIRLIHKNKLGICEMVELLFVYKNISVGEAGAPITGFKNEGYSETFANVHSDDLVKVYNQNVNEIMRTFFAPEQLLRMVTF